MELNTLSNIKHARLKVKVSRRDKSVESFADDVQEGLTAIPKTLPPKYFYDKIGSKIFEEICDLPEYYPTRTEFSILKKNATDIARLCDDKITLVELGSGNSSKTRLIIETIIKQHSRLHYRPIDISKSILVESSKSLLREYRRLKITAYVSDYHTALEVLSRKKGGQKLFLFLGSNIGNFEPNEADKFLYMTRAAMTDQDKLLIGIDLMKDKKILEAAYDDEQGVTARFNMNLLVRINRELDGDFVLSKFRHEVRLNENLGRIEMHLESTQKQLVTLNKLNSQFTFEQKETIHTENSYKFTVEQINTLARRNGFEVQRSWFDPQKLYSLNLFQPIS